MKCARSDAKTRDHPCNFEQRAQLAFCQVSGISEENEVYIECKFSILYNCGNYSMVNQYGTLITTVWAEIFWFLKKIAVLYGIDDLATKQFSALTFSKPRVAPGTVATTREKEKEILLTGLLKFSDRFDSEKS